MIDGPNRSSDESGKTPIWSIFHCFGSLIGLRRVFERESWDSGGLRLTWIGVVDFGLEHQFQAQSRGCIQKVWCSIGGWLNSEVVKTDKAESVIRPMVPSRLQPVFLGCLREHVQSSLIRNKFANWSVFSDNSYDSYYYSVLQCPRSTLFNLDVISLNNRVLRPLYLYCATVWGRVMAFNLIALTIFRTLHSNLSRLIEASQPCSSTVVWCLIVFDLNLIIMMAVFSWWTSTRQCGGSLIKKLLNCLRVRNPKPKIYYCSGLAFYRFIFLSVCISSPWRHTNLRACNECGYEIFSQLLFSAGVDVKNKKDRHNGTSS